MSEIETGGPAFPCEQHETLDGSWNQTFDPGMTLRDWFAGQALAACIQKCVPQECNTGENMEQMFARKAFLVADAMLATRTAAKGDER